MAQNFDQTTTTQTMIGFKRDRETDSAQEKLNVVKEELEGHLEQLDSVLAELKAKAREQYLGSNSDVDYVQGLKSYVTNLKTSFEHKYLARCQQID